MFLLWLTTQEVARLLGVTDRTVWRNIQNYDYKLMQGKGGKSGTQYIINADSLELPTQAPTPIDDLNGKQLEEANFKKGCVSEYWRMGLPPAEYVAFQNYRQPERPITESQLFRWQRIINNGGGLAELADRRGGHNKGKWSMSEDAWETFCGLYYTQQKRSAQRCWEFTQRIHHDIPTVDAFLRRIKAEIPEFTRLEYREGKTALKDKLPSMMRDRTVIDSNDVWVSDHHKMDVFVRNQRGKAVRPWLTVFFDERSRRVMSAVLRDGDPNAATVKKCFRIGVEQNETTPLEVYFDNGKDYRSKSFRRDYPMSLVNQLGINTIYATPYHGQAKSVERFFGTLEDRFGKLWHTYAGKDAKNRPECMRISNEKIAKIAPEWEEFEGALNAYIHEYNHTPHTGQGMDGKCPEEIYFENLKVKRIIRDHDALRLLCGASYERKVNQNGINIRNNLYQNDILLNHVGKDVVVVFDPENIDLIAVFDNEYNAICMAKARNLSPFRRTTEDDFAAAMREKKAAMRVSKQHKAGREYSVQELIAIKQLEEKRYTETGEVQTLEHLPAKSVKNAKVLKRNTAEKRRQADDESVTSVIQKRFEQQMKALGG